MPRWIIGLLVAGQLLVIAQCAHLSWTLRAPQPEEHRSTLPDTAFLAERIEDLTRQIAALSSRLLAAKPDDPPREPGPPPAGAAAPAPVAAAPAVEPESAKPILDAKKVIRELGKDAAITSKTCSQWDLETFAGFLRDKAGVNVDVQDLFLAESMGYFIKKHALSMKILDLDRMFGVAKARKQLEAEGRFEELAPGMPIPPVRREPGSEASIVSVVSTSGAQRRFLIPPSEFPEILAGEEKRSLESFERMLEEIGAFLAEIGAEK